MGTNLAILQNLGIIGKDMHSSNVTLAAEIVDINDFCTWEYCEQKNLQTYNKVKLGTLKDIRDITYGLRYLLKAVNKFRGMKPSRQQLCDIFMESFVNTLNSQQLEQQQINKEALIEACQLIVYTVLVKKENLRALKHKKEDETPYTVSDWELGFTPDN